MHLVHSRFSIIFFFLHNMNEKFIEDAFSMFVLFWHYKDYLFLHRWCFCRFTLWIGLRRADSHLRILLQLEKTWTSRTSESPFVFIRFSFFPRIFSLTFQNRDNLLLFSHPFLLHEISNLTTDCPEFSRRY